MEEREEGRETRGVFLQQKKNIRRDGEWRGKEERMEVQWMNRYEKKNIEDEWIERRRKETGKRTMCNNEETVRGE